MKTGINAGCKEDSSIDSYRLSTVRKFLHRQLHIVIDKEKIILGQCSYTIVYGNSGVMFYKKILFNIYMYDFI